jgi:hypothetical protein
MRSEGRGQWLAMIALLIVTTGCSQPAQSSRSSDDVAVLPCQDVIGSEATLRSGYSAILDGVALPTGRALQASASGGSTPDSMLFAKDGLLIRRGASFDILVPNEWHGRLKIGWGSPGKPTTHLRVPGCRPTERNPASGRWSLGDQWLAYPGGYWISQPACVSVVVQAEHAQQTVNIGVGAACPGESPPPPPA